MINYLNEVKRMWFDSHVRLTVCLETEFYFNPLCLFRRLPAVKGVCFLDSLWGLRAFPGKACCKFGSSLQKLRSLPQQAPVYTWVRASIELCLHINWNGTVFFSVIFFFLTFHNLYNKWQWTASYSAINVQFQISLYNCWMLNSKCLFVPIRKCLNCWKKSAHSVLVTNEGYSILT